MPDISKIKIDNNIYNLKDENARLNGYAKVVCSWDGNTEGLEKISLIPGKLEYYRVGDAIDLAEKEYLIASSSSLSGIIIDNEEFLMVTMMISVLGHVNALVDGISFKNDYAKLYDSYLKEAQDIPGMSALLEQGESFGLSFLGFEGFMSQLGLAPHYINNKENLTLTAELMNAIYGQEEEVTFSPGLWLVKADLGESAGYSTLPVFPEVLYIPSESATTIMDNGLKRIKLFSAEHSCQFIVQGGGLQNKTATTAEYYDGQENEPTTSAYNFNTNQWVYVWLQLLDSTYEVTNITVYGLTSEESFEVSEFSRINNVRWYRFAMPNESVQIQITCAQTAT